jgi:hypothetical protein
MMQILDTIIAAPDREILPAIRRFDLRTRLIEREHATPKC